MKRPGAGACLGLVLLLACGASAAAEAPGPTPGSLDLEALMGHFARSRGVEAEFREEKRLPVLVTPLVSEGVIYFAPPDRMARFTRVPDVTSLVVIGSRLRIEDGLGVDEIDLSGQRVARRFVDQLLVLFRGDLAALRRDYEVDFDSQGEAWTLRLASKAPEVRRLVEEFSMRGRRGQLEEMVVVGARGELTRTTYGRVVTDRAFREDELATLFPAAGSPHPLAPPGARP